MNLDLTWNKSAVVFTCLLAFSHITSAASLGTAFSYQGRLSDRGQPANGSYDLLFSLYDDPTAGSQVGAGVTNLAVAVVNGVFSVDLDFGTNSFTGDGRWLEIAVRTNGASAFLALSPRQPIDAVPYALFAPSAGLASKAASIDLNSVNSASLQDGAVTGSKLAAGAVVRALNGLSDNVLLQAGSNVVLSVQGNALTFAAAAPAGPPGPQGPPGSADAWGRGGNAGTTPSTNFVGTLDNQPLELRVNDQRALRLEPTAGSPNVIGGFGGNSVDTNATGVTIAGGGGTNAANYVPQTFFAASAASYASIGGGSGNVNEGPYSAIGGGYANLILMDSSDGDLVHYGTIGGGFANSVLEGGFGCDFPTISGGYSNKVSGSTLGTVAGGSANFIDEHAYYGTIAGGQNNWLAYGFQEAIGGGDGNYIFTYASTIGGGENNWITGQEGDTGISTIGGGLWNFADLANYSTISGGDYNEIRLSYGSTIAGGSGNLIAGVGSFLIAGAIGGGESNVVNGSYGVVPGGFHNAATNYAFAAGYRAKATNDGAFVWAAGNTNDYPSQVDNRVHIYAANGVKVENGGQNPDGSGLRWMVLASTVSGRMINVYNGAYLSEGGTWVDSSDRNLKENFQPVSPGEVLERVAALPLTSWNYRAEDKSVKHLGPMAQDFSAAFGLGADDKHISPLDSSGVALAAIQGLNQLVKDKDSEIQSLKREMAELKAMVENLAKARATAGQ